MGFLSKSKIKASQIVEQAAENLTKMYDNAVSVFTPSSPFGQLLITIANIFELNMTYLSHAEEELNINTAHTPEAVHGLAALTGHNAYRGCSAKGIISFRPNTSASSFVGGNYIRILNHSKVFCSNNGLTYFMNMKSEWVRLDLNNHKYSNIEIIEGELETQTFTSDGGPLQSFNPIIKGMSDHDYVIVTVNGEEWIKRDSLYDMNYNEKSFMCKTSISVGLSIFFGNGEYGMIPANGSEIKVTYIKTVGLLGNVNVSDMNIQFMDTAIDEFGNEIDLNQCLDVNIVQVPMLGADYENTDFTRLIAPKASKSFVLATPENYISYLSKYNQYKFINAYNTKDDANIQDDNITYLNILPDVSKKFISNFDYFSLPETEYILTETEKENIIKTLDDSGRMLINSEVVINDFKIEHYVINVAIKYFESYNTKDIKDKVRSILNTYFININRKDIIPQSDLISLVESIEGVDTCNVFFLTQKNEEAKINGYYTKEIKVWDQSRLMYNKEEVTVKIDAGSDPQIYFDNLGNISYNNSVIMLPRGGWTDSEGNYYEETPTEGKLSNLNVIFLDSVAYDSYNLKNQKQFNKILKSQLK